MGVISFGGTIFVEAEKTPFLCPHYEVHAIPYRGEKDRQHFYINNKTYGLRFTNQNRDHNRSSGLPICST